MLYTLIIRGTPEVARIEAASRGLELLSVKEGDALIGATIAEVQVAHGEQLCGWFEEHRDPRASGALAFFTREDAESLEQRLAV